jgi:putative transposon-encoded protein
MRKITLEKGEFTLKDSVIELLERKVTPFGTSAKADIPKKHIGKRIYVLILED